jgi:hypothetical protein
MRSIGEKGKKDLHWDHLDGTGDIFGKKRLKYGNTG